MSERNYSGSLLRRALGPLLRGRLGGLLVVEVHDLAERLDLRLGPGLLRRGGCLLRAGLPLLGLGRCLGLLVRRRAVEDGTARRLAQRRDRESAWGLSGRTGRAEAAEFPTHLCTGEEDEHERQDERQPPLAALPGHPWGPSQAPPNLNGSNCLGTMCPPNGSERGEIQATAALLVPVGDPAQSCVAGSRPARRERGAWLDLASPRTTRWRTRPQRFVFVSIDDRKRAPLGRMRRLGFTARHWSIGMIRWRVEGRRLWDFACRGTRGERTAFPKRKRPSPALRRVLSRRRAPARQQSDARARQMAPRQVDLSSLQGERAASSRNARSWTAPQQSPAICAPQACSGAHQRARRTAPRATSHARAR